MVRVVSKKYPVSLPFGARYPLSWRYRWNSALRFLAGLIHKGTDYATGVGKKVRAPIKMQIIAYGYDSTYGDYVYAGSKDYKFLFAHLSVIASIVRPGKIIKENEVFAWTGNTGRYTTGAHLHVEFWKKINSKWVLSDIDKWSKQDDNLLSKVNKAFRQVFERNPWAQESLYYQKRITTTNPLRKIKSYKSLVDKMAYWKSRNRHYGK